VPAYDALSEMKRDASPRAADDAFALLFG